MLKSLGKILWLLTLILAGALGIWLYETHFSTAHQIARLEAEKRELEQIVQRLTAERRVAEILVTDQKTVDGRLQSTLLFVEYDKTGQALPGKSFTVTGKMVHIDAMVIKFDRGFVKDGDALKGKSIALFTRIYADDQSPASASSIDEPGKIPPIYQGADPRASEFELALWQDFWRLADDADYRKSKSVRVAQGEGLWGPFSPGRLYTLTLEADGGLNLSSEPLKGIYKEALKSPK